MKFSKNNKIFLILVFLFFSCEMFEYEDECGVVNGDGVDADNDGICDDNPLIGVWKSYDDYEFDSFFIWEFNKDATCSYYSLLTPYIGQSIPYIGQWNDMIIRPDWGVQGIYAQVSYEDVVLEFEYYYYSFITDADEIDDIISSLGFNHIFNEGNFFYSSNMKILRLRHGTGYSYWFKHDCIDNYIDTICDDVE